MISKNYVYIGCIFAFIAVLGWGLWQNNAHIREKCEKAQVIKEKEIVMQEKEVIKYVEKQKAEIYTAPNAGRDVLIGMYNNGSL